MKKIISLFLITASLCTSVFAVLPKKVDFTGAITSGIPVYGSEEVSDVINSVDNPNRILIGTFANLNINPNKYVTFYTGAELLADFCWNSDMNASLLHFDIPVGLKVYPNLAGFNLGIAYTFGFCNMMIKDQNGDKNYSNTPWGNGFKLTAEYDFSRQGKSIHYPAIGAAWNLMPRGNYDYDNIITLYLMEHF